MPELIWLKCQKTKSAECVCVRVYVCTVVAGPFFSFFLCFSRRKCLHDMRACSISIDFPDPKMSQVFLRVTKTQSKHGVKYTILARFYVHHFRGAYLHSIEPRTYKWLDSALYFLKHILTKRAVTDYDSHYTDTQADEWLSKICKAFVIRNTEFKWTVRQRETATLLPPNRRGVLDTLCRRNTFFMRLLLGNNLLNPDRVGNVVWN